MATNITENGEINIAGGTKPKKFRKRKNNRFLKCMTLNARSLRHKMDELRRVAEIHKPKIISVTETWGDGDVQDEVFKINDYNFYRHDRKDRKGSGTLLYIHKKLGQRTCKALMGSQGVQDYDSSVWCWVSTCKGKKILVGSIYRSPTSTPENDKKLLKMLEKANDVSGENRLLVMGDFNVPKIDWIETDIMMGARPIDKEFFETITDNFMHQHVTVPTRISGSERSTLDLIFTKEEDDIKNVNVIQPVGSSDHGIVMGDFICEWKSRVEPKLRRAYYKGNYDAFSEKLNQINWIPTFSGKSTGENWRHYINTQTKLVEENVPMVSPKDYNEPWMNRKIMRLWKRKYHAWQRVTENNTSRRWREYKEERNRLKYHIRKTKRTFEKKIAEEARHNKRAFYKYVNSRLTVRPEITQVIDGEGKFVESDKEIGDVIGQYFSSVHPPYYTGEMPDMQHVTQNQIGRLTITPKMVEDKLEKLNIHKSCGPDNVHPHVLQKTAKATSVPLSHIFQQSLDTGEVPEDWRTANITPIHKKGDRTDPSNYRPVSLTSQVCKVLESIVRDKIVDHLATNNLLSEAQHGFRQGRSCLTNLLETLELWTDILDEGDCADVAYLDFRKAFDLVSHKLLIYKMSKYGISGQILEWVKNFLNNRTQRVVIRGTASEEFKVTSGVPQGSVLGPILFLIFINDLPSDIISPISLFADDSKIFTRIVTKAKTGKLKISSPNGKDVLQNDLDRIQDWAKKWKMEFNIDKCKIMHLGYNNPNNVYSMDGINLNETNEEKDLGVTIDCKLEFDSHIRTVVAKANRVLGMIRISFACLNKTMFLNLYKGLVRPLLEYCVQAWSPHKKKYIGLLEGVQIRATRLVPELRELSYEERLEKLGLTKLVDRRIRGDMIETYKIITGKENIDPGKFFTMARVRGARNGTHSRKIQVQYTRIGVRTHFFSQRVIKLWNKLTPEEVEALRTTTFKDLYDKLEADRVKEREDDIYEWV